MDVAVVSPSGKNSINSFNFELNKDLLSNIIQDKFKEAPTLTYSEQESKKESRNKILMGTSLGLLGFSAVVGGVVAVVVVVLVVVVLVVGLFVLFVINMDYNHAF